MLSRSACRLCWRQLPGAMTCPVDPGKLTPAYIVKGRITSFAGDPTRPWSIPENASQNNQQLPYQNKRDRQKEMVFFSEEKEGDAYA